MHIWSHSSETDGAVGDARARGARSDRCRHRSLEALDQALGDYRSPRELLRVPPTPGRSRGPWHMHGGQQGFHSPAACLAVERRFEFAPRILPRTAAALPLRCFPSRALCVVLFFSCAAAAAIASSWALSTAVPPQKPRERARAKAHLRRKVEGRSEWFRAPCVRLASCSAARRSPEPSSPRARAEPGRRSYPRARRPCSPLSRDGARRSSPNHSELPRSTPLNRSGSRRALWGAGCLHSRRTPRHPRPSAHARAVHRL